MSASALRRRLLAALAPLLLAACSLIAAPAKPAPVESATVVPALSQATEDASAACPATEPVWAKPPDDGAVLDEPDYGYYFINADGSIWASAWFAGSEFNEKWPRSQGYKVGWFRPEGADLEVTGRRLDEDAPPLEFQAPCCYPTRFQASGLYFSTGGCWEVTARVAGSELSFTVWIEP
jgi:hypothetical protein